MTSASLVCRDRPPTDTRIFLWPYLFLVCCTVLSHPNRGNFIPIPSSESVLLIESLCLFCIKLHKAWLHQVEFEQTRIHTLTSYTEFIQWMHGSQFSLFHTCTQRHIPVADAHLAGWQASMVKSSRRRFDFPVLHPLDSYEIRAIWRDTGKK